MVTLEYAYCEFNSMLFVPPTTYYYRNSIGNYIFLRTSSRKVAQEWLDQEYGKGFFTIRAAKTKDDVKLKENKTPGSTHLVRGTATRKGQKKY